MSIYLRFRGVRVRCQVGVRSGSAIFASVCAVGLAACASPAAGVAKLNPSIATPGAAANPSVNQSAKLEFVADAVLPTGTQFENVELGGLSGAVYDAKNRRFLMISDDRSQKAPARIYSFEIATRPNAGGSGNGGDSQALQVTPKAIITLRDEHGQTFPPRGIDGESITLDPSGELAYVSSEGDIGAHPIVMPEIFVVGLRANPGQVQRRLAIPAKFLPIERSGEQDKRRRPKTGLRDNAAFEGLGLTADGRTLFAAAEAPLHQDGPTPDFASPGKPERFLTRIVAFDLKAPASQAPREFAYPLSALPLPEGHSPVKGGDNGISEILVRDPETLWVMERAFIPFATGGRVFARLFEVSLKNAVDVAKYEALPPDVVPLSKRLIADFDEFVPQLTGPIRMLDNLEALALGPTASDGLPTLLVASDNNFSRVQRSQFLWFKIHPTP